MSAERSLAMTVPPPPTVPIRLPSASTTVAPKGTRLPLACRMRSTADSVWRESNVSLTTAPAVGAVMSRVFST
ncbi:hypothetical protein D3C86_1994910 [compost metagenome]